jgi:hypothetical protein
MKLKHGMRVTCEIAGTKITNAKISQDDDGEFFICQNEKDGTITEEMFGYESCWSIGGGSEKELGYFGCTNLKPLKRDIGDIDSYLVGDVIENDIGQEAEILMVCGKVFVRSTWDAFDTASGLYTAIEAKENGWKFKDSEQEDSLIGKEVTVEIDGKKYLVKVKEEA